VDRFQPTFAEFLKAGDDEPIDLKALGLQPITAHATLVRLPEPLGHDTLGADLAHSLAQLGSATDNVIDLDDALATGVSDDLLQHFLCVAQ